MNTVAIVTTIFFGIPVISNDNNLVVVTRQEFG